MVYKTGLEQLYRKVVSLPIFKPFFKQIARKIGQIFLKKAKNNDHKKVERRQFTERKVFYKNL